MALFAKEKTRNISVVAGSFPRSVTGPPQDGASTPVIEASEGFYPGISYDEGQAHRQDRHHVLFIAHRDRSGEVKLRSFEEAGAAQRFIAGLLTDGVSQDAIDCYQASSLKIAYLFPAGGPS